MDSKAYEILYIIKPNLGEEETNKICSEVHMVVSK